MKHIFQTLLFLLTTFAAQAQTEYAAIDSHARSIRKKGHATPDVLAKDLCKNLKTDRDKARAIFTWVTENIDYNIKGMDKKGPKAHSQADYNAKRMKAAYKKEKGICMDYALIYKEMATAVGLECAFITGYARKSTRGHAWNAVKIDGQWQLLDATWGAGYTEEKKKKFHREFAAGYFFTPPYVFALDHFPDDAKWQLLDKPMDKLAFKKQPTFSYGDLVSGITDTAPFGVPLTKGTDGKIELRLKIQQAPEFIHLKMGGRKLEFERFDHDGWTTLCFKPAGREVQVWLGEETKATIHTTLMGTFAVQ